MPSSVSAGAKAMDIEMRLRAGEFGKHGLQVASAPVCLHVFIESNGIATAHVDIPARAPAQSVASGVKEERPSRTSECPCFVARNRFAAAYTLK